MRIDQQIPRICSRSRSSHASWLFSARCYKILRVSHILLRFESLGLGHYRITGQRVEADPDAWITVAEAAKLCGLRPRSIYPLLGDLLVYKRPLPARRLVSRKSALALHDAVAANPKFWRDQAARAAIGRQVDAETTKMTAPADFSPPSSKLQEEYPQLANWPFAMALQT